MFAKSRITTCVAAAIFAFSLSAQADTIRLRNGSVIKGKIVEMKNQQVTVELDGAGNRRSQLTIYLEEIKAIEFDDQPTASPVSNTSLPVARENDEEEDANRPTPVVVTRNENAVNNRQTAPENSPILRPSAPPQPTNQNSGGLSQVINSQPTTAPAVLRPSNGGNTRFIPAVNLKILADSTANGWTNSGIVVRKGQKIRISARGRISLGSGRYATPAGVGSIPDGERLMKTEPTGALIAVIGDDNNEFIYIGNTREFIAERDGTLFLGINEGNLDDNSGAFDVTLEAEAMDATAQR